jgi:hypothetical protein
MSFFYGSKFSLKLESPIESRQNLGALGAYISALDRIFKYYVRLNKILRKSKNEIEARNSERQLCTFLDRNFHPVHSSEMCKNYVNYQHTNINIL